MEGRTANFYNRLQILTLLHNCTTTKMPNLLTSHRNVHFSPFDVQLKVNLREVSSSGPNCLVINDIPTMYIWSEHIIYTNLPIANLQIMGNALITNLYSIHKVYIVQYTIPDVGLYMRIKINLAFSIIIMFITIMLQSIIGISLIKLTSN